MYAELISKLPDEDSKAVKNHYIFLSKEQSTNLFIVFSDFESEQMIEIEHRMASEPEKAIAEYLPHSNSLTPWEKGTFL